MKMEQSVKKHTLIFALEEFASFSLCFLNLQKIGVDKISDIPSVKGFSVLLDIVLEIVCHFTSILVEFAHDVLQAGYVFQHGEKIYVNDTSKKPEAFLSQRHEFLVSRVSMVETNPHCNRTDDIADGHAQGVGHVCGRATS